MVDPKVFKAYDVRGMYPGEIDEDGAYAIGRAYVQQFEPRRVAVGRDMRLSSPGIGAAVVAGASDEGAEVLDLGLVGTEMVYFAVGSLGLDGGVMVTASHNPKEYTGMKIVRRGALPVGGESGLLDVRDRALGLVGSDRLGGGAGRVSSYDIWPAYVDRVLAFIDISVVRPLKVVIDAANGMAGTMLPPVLERLPVDAVRYFFEPDGSFPRKARISVSPSTATRIAASSSMTAASSSPAISRRRCWLSSCWRRSRVRRSSTTCGRRGRCRRRFARPVGSR